MLKIAYYELINGMFFGLIDLSLNKKSDWHTF